MEKKKIKIICSLQGKRGLETYLTGQRICKIFLRLKDKTLQELG